MREQFRQGDVFLERTDIELPDSVELVERDNGRVVLAYGEVTGHAHAIQSDDVKYYRDKNTTKLYLVVDNTAKLQHEEHSEITLKKGMYEIIRQREYSPEEIRYVAD